MLTEALKVARETPQREYKKGVAALFTRINTGWGIKLYDSKYVRDETYNLQFIAHSVGAAPQLGEKFEVSLPFRSGTYYGYVTECITKTYKDVFDEDYGDVDSNYSYNEINKIQDEMEESDEYKDLINKLKMAGIGTSDMHWANVGWMPDGRFVAIDFSEEIPGKDNQDSYID